MKKIFISLVFSFSIFAVVFGIIELEKFFINSQAIGIRFFDPIERILLDLRFFYREKNFSSEDQIKDFIENSPYVSKEALIVGIDQESLIEIGEWPWYRYVYKDFLKKVQHFSPLSVHLDIIFNLNDEIPPFVENRLYQQSPQILRNVKENFYQMDEVFIDELKNHNNVFVDQFLLKSRFLRFEPDFVRKLALNEEVLTKNAIPVSFPENYAPPYVFTEPLIPGVMQNSIPAVVNAESDSDRILRKAILLYPYQTQKNEKILLTSIYIHLLLKYYNIPKENLEILADRIVLRDTMAPTLDPINKDPIMEVWELPQLSSVLTPRHFQEQKYNQDLYRYIINIFQGRFQQDDVKMPDYPIQLLDNQDGTYSIISGREIYDAATTLKSKSVKVIVKTRKNIEIPIFDNQDGNPFSIYINFASKQLVQGNLKGVNISEFTMPKISFKDVYNGPDLPTVPDLEGTTSQENLALRMVARQDIRTWFEQSLEIKIKEMQKTVFNLYRDISPSSMLNYAVQDNHFEGFFYLIHLYLKDRGWVFRPQSYENFVKSLFEKNRISSDHPLVTDFIFSPDVIYDFLIDAYGQGFNKFYNKSIFVGALTTGMALDVHKTTYGDMFGITTIVNSFNTVIKDNQLMQVDYFQEIFMLLLICIIAGLAYSFLPLVLKFVFIFLMTVTIFGVSLYLFTEGYLLNTSPFIFANILTFPVVILYSVFIEQRDKRFLQLSFSDYLAPELIEEMYEKKERPQLGGEEKTIAAYFTDIQGFSSFSELLTASQLVELLNEYLGKMTDILMAQKGTLDKYEGDAIISFFGAPSHLGDESLRACKTAIEMQTALVDLTEKWKLEKTSENLNQKGAPVEKWDPVFKWPFLVHNMKMRIGINTGSVVVGNMGSEKRKNYTMMGDPVNLAARLESLAKQYGIYTLISENVMDHVNDTDPDKKPTKDFIYTRLLDRVTVVGKEEPIHIFELFCLTGDESENVKSLKKNYEAGMKRYFKMDWNEAIECFTASNDFEANKKINPSMIMLRRCKLYRQNSPVKDGGKWDGVFRQTEK